MKIVAWGFYLSAGATATAMGLPFEWMLVVCGLMLAGAACEVIASGGLK